MKKPVMELYVHALRSGEFKQIRYQLENKKGVDPLGLLCNLALVECVCDYDCYNGEAEFDGEAILLPDSVMEWAGMKTNNGYIKSLRLNLSQLNDQGYTFNEIADIIEKKYKEL